MCVCVPEVLSRPWNWTRSPTVWSCCRKSGSSRALDSFNVTPHTAAESWQTGSPKMRNQSVVVYLTTIQSYCLAKDSMASLDKLCKSWRCSRRQRPLQENKYHCSSDFPHRLPHTVPECDHKGEHQFLPVGSKGGGSWRREKDSLHLKFCWQMSPDPERIWGTFTEVFLHNGLTFISKQLSPLSKKNMNFKLNVSPKLFFPSNPPF